MDIRKLTSQERMRMIELNLNPINPDHVEAFKNGQTISKKTLQQENIERLGGIGALRNNLGSRKEKEINISDIESGRITADDNFTSSRTTDYREEVNRKMEGYVGSGRNSLNENFSSMQSNLNQENYIDENSVISKLSINYYQAFVESLKNQKIETAINVFNNLKALLEMLLKIKKENPAQYQTELINFFKVTEDFYQQIKK